MQGLALVMLVLASEVATLVLYIILWQLTVSHQKNDGDVGTRSPGTIRAIARAGFATVLATLAATVYVYLRIPIGFAQGPVPSFFEFASYFLFMSIADIVVTLSLGAIVWFGAYFVLRFFSDLPVLLLRATNYGLNEGREDSPESFLPDRVAQLGV